MHVDVASTAEEAAELAASLIAAHVQAAFAARGRATLALSGGSTPVRMVECLASYDLPWQAIELFQVDERFVAANDAARNWSTLAPVAQRLLPEHRHPMPVDDVDPDDLRQASAIAMRYDMTLRERCGTRPVLDVVHLGLGDDGHTASIVPGDAVIDAVDRFVAVTQTYRGHRRLTVTMPVLGGARCLVWLVVGAAKADPVAALLRRDEDQVAARVANEHATLVIDSAAAVGVPQPL